MEPTEETPKPDIIARLEALKPYRWHFVITLGLIVAVLLVMATIDTLQKKKENRAYLRLSYAKDAEEFLLVAREYRGTFQAQVALKKAADALYQKKQFSQARKYYEQFLELYPENPISPWVANMIAATWEAEGKIDKAIEAYIAAKDNHINSGYLEDQIIFNLGRCHEIKGNFNEARTHYNQLMWTYQTSDKEVTPSPWMQLAQMRLALVRSKEELKATGKETD